ncbi:MAG: hypothetical protein IT324_03825 [Anaerolineae bacterium]|nr:hypothetical protein [Anaerolineae bacterium]
MVDGSQRECIGIDKAPRIILKTVADKSPVVQFARDTLHTIAFDPEAHSLEQYLRKCNLQ